MLAAGEAAPCWADCSSGGSGVLCALSACARGARLQCHYDAPPSKGLQPWGAAETSTQAGIQEAFEGGEERGQALALCLGRTPARLVGQTNQNHFVCERDGIVNGLLRAGLQKTCIFGSCEVFCASFPGVYGCIRHACTICGCRL